MTIFKGFLPVTLMFSMLGSFATQDLVAMKRTALSLRKAATDSAQLNDFTAAQLLKSLLFAIEHNDVKLVKTCLASRNLQTDDLHIALVTAATKGNVEAFDLLRGDARVTDTSPFPLGDLMVASVDIFRLLTAYLPIRDRLALECANVKSHIVLQQ